MLSVLDTDEMATTLASVWKPSIKECEVTSNMEPIANTSLSNVHSWL